MSHKKKRIAKGLSASALAVATIASGLSFGSAATAATAGDPRALEASQTYEPFYINAAPSTISGRWFALESKSPALADRDPYILSGAKDELAAQAAATRVSVPEHGRWLQLHVEGTERCLTGDGLGIYARACDTASAHQRWTLDDEGHVVNRGSNQWIDASYGSVTIGGRAVAAITLGVGEPTFSFGGDWAGNPADELSASVTFSDNVDERATVAGTTEAEGVIEVRENGKRIASGSAGVDGDFSIPIDAPDRAGDCKLQVALVESGADKKTIDVTAAYGAGVKITSPSGDDAVSGPVTVTGTAQSDSRVTLQIGQSEPVSVTLSGNGQWQRDVVLPMGETTITATATSKGANSTTSTVVVNPGEGAVELTADGRFDAADATKPATAFGAAPTGSTVVLRNSIGTEIGRTAAKGDAYEIVIDPTKATSGVNTFSVVIEGAPESESKSFTLDYGRPAAAVVVTKPVKNGTVEPGLVEFAGTGETGSKIVVRGSSREVASATVTAGSWTATSTVELSRGDYDLYFDQTSKGGLKSTIRHAFTVGQTAPIVTPVTVTSPDADEVLDTLSPEFRGTGHEGATITVRGSSRIVATGTVRNGQWVAQTDEDAPLAAGSYNLYVDQSIRGTVVETIRVSFTVSNEAFRELTLSAPAQGENVLVLRPTWVGTATPGAEIRVGSSRTTVATATVGEDGTYRATALFDLARGGTYAGLEVKQTTKTGKTSTVSSTITVDRNAQ